MGKKNRNRKNKMKGCKNPASNKTKKIAPFTNNRLEGDIDEKKSSQKSTEEVMEASNFPKTMTGGMDYEKGSNRFNEDIMVAVQSSPSKVMVMTDKDIKEKLDVSVESMTMGGNISSSQDKTNSSAEGSIDFSFLKSKDLELLERLVKSNMSKAHQRCLQKHLDILKSSKKLIETEKSRLLVEVIKQVSIDAYEELEREIAKVKNDYNEIPTDLGEIGVENVGTNDDDCSVDDNRKAKHSTEILTLEDKVKKGGGIYTGKSQETGMSLHNEEYDDEALMKIIDCSDEIMGKSKDVYKMSHKNEMPNVCMRQNKFNANLIQEIQLQETRNARLSQKQIREENAEAFEEIKVSKEKEDGINDTIIALSKVESNKKEKYGSFTDYVEIDGQSPQNSSENKKRANKSKEDIEISNEDLQDFYLLKKIDDCKRKHNKDKAIYPKNTNISPIGDFQRDLKEFRKLQSFKLDEQVKKHTELEEISTKEARDLFYFEKEPLAAVTKTELHEDARVSKNNADGRIEEIVKTAELDDEPNEIVMVLKENCDINFQFLSNGDRRIFVCEDSYLYSSTEKQCLTFKYKNECIQVSFTGNQVFVSTRNSEFDIYVQNSIPINLADEATQTDIL